MKRATLLPLLLIGLAAACDRGLPIPERDLMLRVAADTEAVTLGRAFRLTVVRVFAKDLVPDELPDGAFAPLVVRLRETVRREDDRRVEETRRYDAYAFAAGDLVVREIPFTARPGNGGPQREAPGNALRLKVLASLDPAAPGELELPAGPMRRPFPWLPAALAAGVALSGIAVAVLLRRRPARPSPVAVALASPPPGPEVRALAALARLRHAPSRDTSDPEMFCEEVAAVLRGYLAERFSLPAARRTTEELGALLPFTEPEGARLRGALRAALRPADFAKFALLYPDGTGRAAMLDAAEEFVRGTTPAPPAAVGEPA
ncbi:MAG: hypothetical protein MUE73_20385 [Planctomycetes bacterium]|jgi:hypothetical protein|nr:hypothetical protein [Planctomycetota bacterium]